VDSILEILRAALEAGDPAPMVAAFSDDVELHSPAIIGPEYRGADLVASIVTAAVQVLEEVRVTDVLHAEDAATAGVVFGARVRESPSRASCCCAQRASASRNSPFCFGPLPRFVSLSQPWPRSVLNRRSTRALGDVRRP
jgi:hypothetical protein